MPISEVLEATRDVCAERQSDPQVQRLPRPGNLTEKLVQGAAGAELHHQHHRHVAGLCYYSNNLDEVGVVDAGYP